MNLAVTMMRKRGKREDYIRKTSRWVVSYGDSRSIYFFLHIHTLRFLNRLLVVEVLSHQAVIMQGGVSRSRAAPRCIANVEDTLLRNSCPFIFLRLTNIIHPTSSLGVLILSPAYQPSWGAAERIVKGTE